MSAAALSSPPLVIVNTRRFPSIKLPPPSSTCIYASLFFLPPPRVKLEGESRDKEQWRRNLRVFSIIPPPERIRLIRVNRGKEEAIPPPPRRSLRRNLVVSANSSFPLRRDRLTPARSTTLPSNKRRSFV